jgi:hypothetical protein
LYERLSGGERLAGKDGAHLRKKPQGQAVRNQAAKPPLSDKMSYMVKKKSKQLNPGQVIIPASHPNPPEPHEIDTAWVLARHFRCTVEFLIPVDDYMRKTADITMHGVEWEIKSPIGASKSTIGNQFQAASRQSKHIVIDTRRTTLEYDRIEKSVHHEMKKRVMVKRVILINKSAVVIEISR